MAVAAGLIATCPTDVEVDVGVETLEPGETAPPGDDAEEIGVIESCLGRGLLPIPDVVKGGMADAVAILIWLLQGHGGIPFVDAHSSVLVPDAVWRSTRLTLQV